MDEFGIIIIVGAVALMGSLVGGFRLAQIRGQKRPPMLMRVIVALVFIAIYGYLQFGDRLFTQDTPPTSTESARVEMLILNQTSSYTLQAGEDIALTYDGELGQIITLTIIPETGTAPTIHLSSQIDDNPPVENESISAEGNQTTICGYEFTSNATYTFSFQATTDTTYTIEFVDGNSC
jgi:hypothetical protein